MEEAEQLKYIIDELSDVVLDVQWVHDKYNSITDIPLVNSARVLIDDNEQEGGGDELYSESTFEITVQAESKASRQAAVDAIWKLNTNGIYANRYNKSHNEVSNLQLENHDECGDILFNSSSLADQYVTFSSLDNNDNNNEAFSAGSGQYYNAWWIFNPKITSIFALKSATLCVKVVGTSSSGTNTHLKIHSLLHTNLETFDQYSISNALLSTTYDTLNKQLIANEVLEFDVIETMREVINMVGYESKHIAFATNLITDFSLFEPFTVHAWNSADSPVLSYRPYLKYSYSFIDEFPSKIKIDKGIKIKTRDGNLFTQKMKVRTWHL